MSEDPFLWHNARGWHIIYHGMCPSGIMQAHYAFSSDAVHWTESTSETYSYTAEYTDGSSQFFARTERPHLIFSEGGNLTHILNGVCDGSSPEKAYKCISEGDGMTWTLMRPLKQSAGQ